MKSDIQKLKESYLNLKSVYFFYKENIIQFNQKE